jgi:hypothetical protein
LAVAIFIACTDVDPTSVLKPHGANRQLTGTTVVVTPDSLRGWVLASEGTPQATLVSGPGTPPLGTGSIQFSTSTSTDVRSIYNPGFGGTWLSNVTALTMSTYRQAPSTGGSSLSFQFSADWDLADASSNYEGRIIWVPALDGAIHTGTWQTWDLQTQGKWYSTATSVTKGGVSVTNPCVGGGSWGLGSQANSLRRRLPAVPRTKH